MFVATALTALCLSVPPPPRVEFRRLYPDGAVASSFLQNNWNKFQENYHPNYVGDDDPVTAWVEGADGDGLGESLTIPVSTLKTARAVKLLVRAGYHKSQKLFDANAVPKELDVIIIGADGNEEVAKKRVILPKKLDWQEITVELPEDGSLSAVRLVLVSVYPGKSYKDTCISDVQVFADSTVPYNEKVELAKKALLGRWRASRLEDAKYFASLPAEYPFSGTQIEAEEGLRKTETQGEGEKLVQVGEQIRRENKADTVREVFTPPLLTVLRRLQEVVLLKGEPLSKRWYRVAFTRKTVPPDGMPEETWMKSVANYFDPTAFAFFETDKEAGGDSPLKPKDPQYADTQTPKWTVTNARVRYQNKQVKEVYFREEKTVVERETYSTTTHYLLVFGDTQKLDAVAVFQESDEAEQYAVVTLMRNEKHITGGSVAYASFAHLEQYEEPPENAYRKDSFAVKTVTAAAK